MPVDTSRAEGRGDGLRGPASERYVFLIQLGGPAWTGAQTATYRLQRLESLGSPLLTSRPTKQEEEGSPDTFPPAS